MAWEHISALSSSPDRQSALALHKLRLFDWMDVFFEIEEVSAKYVSNRIYNKNLYVILAAHFDELISDD